MTVGAAGRNGQGAGMGKLVFYLQFPGSTGNRGRCVTKTTIEPVAKGQRFGGLIDFKWI
jgi:hypothetical protein